MLLVFTVIFVALVFTYTNGFHDTANAIATVVGTKVLTPRQAIILATITNLLGAMVGAAVAKTIASGLVDSDLIPADFASPMLICALLAAISWNLLTWFFGMPSSSSHALVGGLFGAAIAAAHGNLRAVIWVKAPAVGAHWWTGGGILYKVVIPMVISPVLGFFIAFFLMAFLYLALQECQARQHLPEFWQITARQFGLHGLQPRHERCAKNHGHHRPGAGRCHQGRHV